MKLEIGTRIVVPGEVMQRTRDVRGTVEDVGTNYPHVPELGNMVLVSIPGEIPPRFWIRRDDLGEDK